MLDESRLGQRIKQARKAAHMTAEAFAEAADISVSFLVIHLKKANIISTIGHEP